MREFDQSYCMIPLMFDLSSASVLVIGAGAVGQRKAAYFAGRCKELTILDTVPESLSDIVAAHDFIVAATASSEENERIIGEARIQNKWYNCATGIGNFLIPAAHFEENFTLAVSTNGKAPATAGYIRDKIRDDLPALSAMIALQEVLRSELKNIVPDQTRRAEILREVLADEAVWEALDAGDKETALLLARRHI